MTTDEADPRVYVTAAQLARLRHQARGFSFLPHQPVKSLLAGNHASKLRGRGLDFDEIRKYLPGDDPRMIDWKVTARMRSPYSRVFTEERERPVLLIVDQRIGMFFGSVLKMKSVTAAEAAALAAWRTIAVKDRIGAIVFNDSEIVEVHPLRTRSTVMQILRSIENQNRTLSIEATTKSSPVMLNEALRRAQRLATHDFLVNVITDGVGSDPDTRRLLTTIARHNDVLITFVIDPLEVDLPQGRGLYVTDGERQLALDAGVVRLPEQFRRDFQGRYAAAKHYLLTREVPVLPLRTDAEVLPQVLHALGNRPGTRHA